MIIRINFLASIALETVILFSVYTGVESRANMGAESRLINHLLTNYSRNGRPIINVTNPVQVSITFYLTQLMSLEEKNQVLTTFGWLETFWYDDYLVWNSSEYGNLTQVVLSPELVWLPDFGVENSAKAIYDELFFRRFRVSVTEAGLVNWVPGGKFLTSCQLDITFYPFDDQECHIDLVDWAYHGLQVKLSNGSATIGLDAYKESGEWQILGTKAESSDQYYESDPGVPFPRVRFTLSLRRKSMFYTINIITPCITMSLLALLVFYLPPDSGEKVSLGITVLLSFSVFLILVSENIPKTSEFVPLLGIYLTLIMAMTAMSILICVIVLNLHHRDSSTPVPPWLHHTIYHFMAYAVCMRGELRTQARTSVYKLCEFTREYAHSAANTGNHDNHMNEYSSCAADDNGLCDHVSYLVRNTGKKKSVLEEILKNVRHITSKMKENDEQDAIKAEWKLVAKVLDRFFLLFFVLLVVVSSVVLLIVYPALAREDAVPLPPSSS